jgi:hypothetical protein
MVIPGPKLPLLTKAWHQVAAEGATRGWKCALLLPFDY